MCDDTEEAGFLLCVKIPDLQSQTRIVGKQSDTVLAAKQAVLSKLTEELPNEQFNYGFYMDSSLSGRPAKYLDESRLLSDYSLKGVTQLEFVYKRRDYSAGLSLTEKAITKANTKSNQKKLIDHVQHGSVRKIEKLLDSGLDPNIILEDGNTPLGMVCGRNGKVDCILPLLSGGAHIDYRGSGGLTPIHRAAIGGNAQAIKTLLSLGSSPNYIDEKGLTPLYHAAIMGDDVSVCEALLKHKSTLVGTTDLIGWNELHQIAKHGNTHLVDVMVLHGVDINAQNKAGNTPLHVAAQHGQLKVALHLMKRGADRTICNSSNQPPNQVAILCGHRSLAKEILNFSESSKEPIKQAGVTSRPRTKSPSPNGPHSSNTLPLNGRGSGAKHGYVHEHQQHKASTIPRRKIEETSRLGDTDDIETTPLTGSSGSGSSQSSPQPGMKHRYSDSRKKSQPSMSPVQAFASSTSGSSSFPELRPVPFIPSSTRERMYGCSPGKKYTVLRNVEPQQPGDLTLSEGMEVEVLYIGKANYWEGKVGDQQGWFPQSAITMSSSDAGSAQKKSSLKKSQTEAETQQGAKQASNIKSLTIHKGPRGFGFAMRGVKSVNVKKFKPDPHVPALQYVGEVDRGGAADCAGLEEGDFIIEVNGVNTTLATHQNVVEVIKKADEVLQMKVITPIRKLKSKSLPSTDVVKTPNEIPETRPRNIQEQMHSIKTPTEIKEQKISIVSLKTSEDSRNGEKDNLLTSSKITDKQMQESSQFSSKTKVIPEAEGVSQVHNDQKNHQSLSDRKQATHQTCVSSGTADGETNTSPTTGKKKYSSKTQTAKKTNGLKKGWDNSANQSPLLQSIRYEEKKGTSESPVKSSNQTTIEAEELKLKEKKMYEKHLEEDQKEEGLSAFTQQIRIASQEHYSRVSTDQPKISNPSFATGKNAEERLISKTSESVSTSDHNSPSKRKIAITDDQLDLSDRETSGMPKSERESEHWSSHSPSADERPENNLHSPALNRQEMFEKQMKTNKMEEEEEEDEWTEVAPSSVENIMMPLDTFSGGNLSPKKSKSLERTEQATNKVKTPAEKTSQTKNRGNPSNQKDWSSEIQTRAESPTKYTKSISEANSEANHTSPNHPAKTDSIDVLGFFTPPKPKPKPPKVSPKPPNPVSGSPRKTPQVSSNKLSSAGPKTDSTSTEEPLSMAVNDSVEEKTTSVLNLREKFEVLSQSSDGSPAGSSRSKINKSLGSGYNRGSPLVPRQSTQQSNEKDQKMGPPEQSNISSPEGTRLSSKDSKDSNVSSDQALKDEKKDEDEVEVELLPPPPENEDLDFGDLPSPQSLSDDEESSRLDDFTPPPPPQYPNDNIMSDEDTDDDNNVLVHPPPPLFDDMDDADLLEDNPPISALPVPLSELIDGQTTDNFSCPPAIFEKPESDDSSLLDNIVGQLQTLVTSHGNSEGSDDEEEELDEPPPLPSEPPPDLDSEGEIQDNALIEQVLSVEEPKTSEDTAGSFLHGNDLQHETKPPKLSEDMVDSFLHSNVLQNESHPPKLSEDTAGSFLHNNVLQNENYQEESLNINNPSFLDLPPPPPEDDLPPLPFPVDLLLLKDSSQSEDLLPVEDLPPPLTPPNMEELDEEEEGESVFLPPPPDALEEEEEAGEDAVNSIELPASLQVVDKTNPPPDYDSTKENTRFSGEQNSLSDVKPLSLPEESELKETHFSSKPLDSWTVDDVCQWMFEVGLEAHIPTFKENEILGEHLRDLTKDDLKDLGISKIGHIKTFTQKLGKYLTTT